MAAGAAVSMTTLQLAEPAGQAYWRATAIPRPSPPGAALNLLESSIAAGATLIAIGPYTNLGLAEIARPGSLGRTPVILMGGWTQPPAEGLPAWGPEMDWNVQWDTRASEIVGGAAAHLTLATLPATLQAHLRAPDMPRLRASGPLRVGDAVSRPLRRCSQRLRVSGSTLRSRG